MAKSGRRKAGQRGRGKDRRDDLERRMIELSGHLNRQKEDHSRAISTLEEVIVERDELREIRAELEEKLRVAGEKIFELSGQKAELTLEAERRDKESQSLFGQYEASLRETEECRNTAVVLAAMTGANLSVSEFLSVFQDIADRMLLSDRVGCQIVDIVGDAMPWVVGEAYRFKEKEKDFERSLEVMPPFLADTIRKLKKSGGKVKIYIGGRHGEDPRKEERAEE